MGHPVALLNSTDMNCCDLLLFSLPTASSVFAINGQSLVSNAGGGLTGTHTVSVTVDDGHPGGQITTSFTLSEGLSMSLLLLLAHTKTFK